MSEELVSILILVAVFLIATLLSINMGVLGLVAAFGLGTALGVSEDDIFAGFPGDLFVILVGVTYLFAIAKNNGTVDWLVHAAVRAVGGRTAAIPWVMFLVTAMLTAVGSVVPAAVAIIAPMGLGFAMKYKINPVLMGLMIINGATAGGFSPISIFGSIVNGVVERNDLASNPGLLFASSFIFNTLLSVVVFFMFGGRELLSRRVAVAGGGDAAEEPSDTAERSPRFERQEGEPAGKTTASPTTSASTPGSDRPPMAGGSGAATASSDDAMDVPEMTRDMMLTIAGIGVLIVTALLFEVSVGFVALSIAVVLAIVSPKTTKNAVNQVAWSTVLLICGVVTYVSLLEEIGTIDWMGETVADVGAPLIAALLICVVGAAVSAFASTTGILGALIPLAVPFLLEGSVGAVGMIIALSISSSVVDSSPFSTSGALVVANTNDERRDFVFRRLMQWGMSMIIIAPVVAWLIFVVPGWL
jgi:di/tricarboxylate transporter